MPVQVRAYDKGDTYEFDKSSLDEALHHPVTWIDISDPSEAELSLVQERFKLDPLAIEDVTHRGQRPKIEDYEDHFFTVLHLPNYVGDELRVEELFLFLGNKWLISIHSGNPSVVGEVAKALRGGPHRLRLKGPDFLYHLLTDLTVDRYFSVLDTIEEKVEALEEQVKEEQRKEVIREIDSMGRQLISLRRSIWPTQEMIGKIIKGIHHFISDQNMKYFRDVHDHLARLIDLVEIHHDRLNSVRNLYLQSLSASLNEVIKVLTLVFTITLPAMLIATIYGMNFQFMPELTWEFGYPLALLLMLAWGGIIALYFKRKGWF